MGHTIYSIKGPIFHLFCNLNHINYRSNSLIILNIMIMISKYFCGILINYRSIYLLVIRNVGLGVTFSL